jgi:hypothetical protein
MEIDNRLDSDTCTDGGESGGVDGSLHADNPGDTGTNTGGGERAGVDGSLHADHPDDIDMHSEGDSQELVDSCLDPIRSDNIVSTGSTQDDQMIDSNQSLDLPDTGSQAVASRSPSPEPPLNNNSPSGPDIEELCGIVEDEDLALYLGFIKLLRNASLDDAGMQMDEEDLERLQNPPRYEISLESEPDLRLALDLFLANYTSSVDAYNQNRKAMLRRHPEDDIYTYDQAKRLVRHLSGIVPLAHDMCINTCIAYTGPFSDLEMCPYCNTPRYDPVVLGKGSEKKTAQRVFHTMPIGPQLQALYRSKESAEKMKYGENKLQEIVDEALKAGGGTQPDFEDWCHGADFIKAFHEGHIKKGDPVLMFSIDGAQLYRSKTSDCWMYIWVIFNLDPATGRYKKAGVLFGGIIPGPNKPKILESFLFPGLHHLSAIQKEGLPIWDASTNTLYVSNPYMALASADGPAMAYINGLVGHQGKIGCRLYCPMKGRRKGSHYYPVCLKSDSVDETSDHPDVLPAEYAHKTFFNYENQLKYVTESQNKTQYKNRRLETGIVKPGIFLGLQPKHTHTIPRCFGYDIMHLVSLNIPDLLISLWRGTIDGDRDDQMSWDFAVLQGPVWKNHGIDVASMTPYLPGSFDRPPRNPAEKINSGYKAWEYLMYIYGLGPGLFYHVLPKPYWQNLCRLVRGIRIAHQHKISMTSLKQAHQFLLNFVLEFEELYYKRRQNRIHFVRPCIHLLTHIAPEVSRAGPGIIGSQWVMERAIGDLGGEIKLPSNPFANLSQRAVLRCQVNALKAILPELDEPKNLLPRGALDLHGGYSLLRAREPSPSLMTDSAAVALRSYYEGEGQQLTDNGTSYKVIRWARLRIPTGQVARSAWKEKQKSISNVRMARNVKLKVGSIDLAFSVLKC